MSRYRVVCQDCDFQEVLDDDEPSGWVIGEVWSAKSAAEGARDNHEMTPYEQEDGSLEWHNVQIKEAGE